MSIDDFKLAYEIIDVIMQTHEWEKIRQNDVRVQTAKKQYEAALQKLDMPKAILDELNSAVLTLEEASADAAILYGIRLFLNWKKAVLTLQYWMVFGLLVWFVKCLIIRWFFRKCFLNGQSNAALKNGKMRC